MAATASARGGGVQAVEEEGTSLEWIGRLVDRIETVFVGKTEVVRLTVTALLAGGHILFEDVPGVGKTTLAQAVSRSIGAHFQRVQFTSDLLPADILGVSIFNRDRQAFEFKPGPIFANVLLADEINRTTPRTQSALLEAMAERRVSIDNTTHTLPRPFVVMGTQNPLEFYGTYPLPESQLDRFLVRLSIGYPGPEVERRLLMSRGSSEPVEKLEPVLSLDRLLALQDAVDTIQIEASLVDYAMRIVEATRASTHLTTGVSTRGALALVRAARAHALVMGRTFCVPDDLSRLCVPVLAHRISLGGPSRNLGSDRREAEALIEEIVASTEVPV